MSLSIPVIDVSPWFSGTTADRHRVAKEFDRAYRDVGFLQVTGHGVPDSTVQGAFDAMDAFFGLPEADKRRCVPDDPELICGYTARLSESFSYSLSIERPPDLVEAFLIGADDVGRDPHTNPYCTNVWPDQPVWFRDRVWQYYTTVRSLSFELCRIAAVALDVDPGFFDGALPQANTMMRCNWYHRRSDEVDLADDQMALGAHTDYGILTVLAADLGPGLQVLDDSGVWHDVAPEPGAFIINAGDALAVWTNDEWRSTVHRVLPSKMPGGRVRRSIALFQDGDTETVMECLPTCHSATNPPKYAPITLGQHVMNKVEAGHRSVLTEAQQTIGDRLNG